MSNFPATVSPLVTLDNETKMPVRFDKGIGLYVRDNKPDDVTAKQLVDIQHAEIDMRQGDTVLDLGAWIGRFARTCFRRGVYRVVSVEGDPNTYALLKRNRDLPDFKTPLQVHKLIGGLIWSEILELESARAYMSVDFSANTSLHTTMDIPGGSRIWSNKVDIIAVLNMFEPDIVKFDIEGGEFRILRYRPNLERLGYVRDVWINWHIRTEWDLMIAKDCHQNLIDTLGSYVIEPNFDVTIPKGRAYFMHETTSLYRNTYQSKVMSAYNQSVAHLSDYSTQPNRWRKDYDYVPHYNPDKG